jgi:Tol biopolymer transport system component
MVVEYTRVKTARFTLALLLLLALLQGLEPRPAAAAHGDPWHVAGRVSIASDGSQANADIFGVAGISADGRFVAFSSGASNLVPGDTNNRRDIFVHDQQTGQTIRVSIASDGSQANDHSDNVSISADGRFVAFSSGASNLVPGDTNETVDCFVHNRDADGNGIFDEPEGIQTSRVSVASNGAQANDPGVQFSSISADGRFIAFRSRASNLVPGDTNGAEDVFVHDQQTRQTTRVSVASDGSQANGGSGAASISADGRFVGFNSVASNLVAGDTNGDSDVFVHDQRTRQTTRVSVASDDSQANGGSAGARISIDRPLRGF